MKTSPHKRSRNDNLLIGGVTLIAVGTLIWGAAAFSIATEPEPEPVTRTKAVTTHVAPAACVEALDANTEVLALYTEMFELHPKAMESLMREDFAAVEAFTSGHYALADRIKVERESVEGKANECRSLTQRNPGTSLKELSGTNQK